MRISDWSSDVCSSDLTRRDGRGSRRGARVGGDRAYRRHHRRPGAGAGGDRMTDTRTDWTREEIAELFDLPFDELMWEAQGIHRRKPARGEVPLCTLLSIKTGGRAEACGACSQSAHAQTGVNATRRVDVRAVPQAASHGETGGG